MFSPVLFRQSIAHLLLLLICLSPSVVRCVEDRNQVCVTAISLAYSKYLTFAGVGNGKATKAMCINPLEVASIYAAARRYCKPEDWEPGFRYVRGECTGSGFDMLPESAVARYLTDDAVRAMRVVDFKEVKAKTNLTEPVMISESYFYRVFHTEDDKDYEAIVQRKYGFAIYGFWGGVLLIGILRRAVLSLYHSRMAGTASDTEEEGSGDGLSLRRKASSKKSLLAPIAALHDWVDTYLVVPSAFRQHRQRLFRWCTIPTRMELLVIVANWITVLVLMFVNYRAFAGNVSYGPKSLQLFRYIANRTGIFACSNLPWIWLFSGRNNIFIWATGWQYPTFNLFHRHLARLITLVLVIHAISYTVYHARIDPTGADIREEYRQSWWRMGMVAVISACLMLFFSMSWLRRTHYEIFVTIHIVFAVIIIIGVYIHVLIHDGMYNPFVWSVVAIWGFDRVVRLVRLAYCNVHVSRNKGTKVYYTRSSVSYDGVGDMMRIQLRLAGNLVKPHVGQHYFLYQPFRWTGYENHPFTLAYWETATDESSGLPETLLEFWVRPMDGWTRHLRDACVSAGDAPISPILLLEGPYGRRTSLRIYDRVLMIAGGSGISAVAPHLLEHARLRDNYGKTRTRSIRLVWTDRSESYMRDAFTGAPQLAATLGRRDVRAEFFVSRGTPSPAQMSSSSASSSDDEGRTPLPEISEKGKGGATTVTSLAAASEKGMFEREDGNGGSNSGRKELAAVLRWGRPDVRALIEEAARDAAEEGSKLAVIVCGPSGLADAARAASYDAMRRHRGTMEYVEEAFCW
ncbi:hypothetical protein VTK73DRAFT_8589 [Phialemonium thermophilum]|uniref:FAD-binding FR-type domain-containing protein n=1 Tax=Phialemonium thermophilum TaxID=223376 RepID=A0ABR3W7K3_9PEZI